jgi:RimJ/RimL family protein N-acetyltransferase
MASVYLRALEISDLERTHRWHNDFELYKTLIGSFHYVSRETEEEWLRKKQTFSPNEINLAICRMEDHQHIGNIYLRSFDWIARNAELHIFIGERENRSKGYGQEAVHQIITYAFKELGLYRLYLPVLEENHAAVRVYEKCGFKLEGKLRKHVFKSGEFKDVLFMGVNIDDLA